MDAYKSPPECNRPPRTLNLAFWKASTFREWVCHCSVLCCEGLVSAERMRSWVAFVQGFLLLSSDAVHPISDLNEAKNLLSSFLQSFEELYGRFQVKNTQMYLLYITVSKPSAAVFIVFPLIFNRCTCIWYQCSLYLTLGRRSCGNRANLDGWNVWF